MTDNRARRAYKDDLLEVDIVVTPQLIKLLGGDGDAAIVIQQIHHWAQYNGTNGWFEASSWDLANLTGFSPDKCRRLVAKLLDAGHVEKQNHRTSRGEQKARYRATINPRAMVSANHAPGDSAGRGHGDSAGPTSSSDKEVTLIRASGDAPALFALPGTDGAAPVTKPKKRRKPVRREYSVEFEAFWQGYPEKANKADAYDYWLELDPAAVLAARDNYVASLAAFAAQYPASEVTPLYGKNFLDGKWENWSGGVWFNPHWPKGGQVASPSMTAEGSFQIATEVLNRLGKIHLDATDQWNAALAELADRPAIQEATKRVGWDAMTGKSDPGLWAWKAAWSARSVGVGA
jgi:hypothetical protein